MPRGAAPLWRDAASLPWRSTVGGWGDVSDVTGRPDRHYSRRIVSFDLKNAQQRVARAVLYYFLKIRADMDALLGPGNHGLTAAVLLQELLGEGQVFTVPGTPDRFVLRKRFGGYLYDTDLYADHFGHEDAVRSAPEDALFDDLVPFDLERVPDEVFQRLEEACATSGPREWASMQPRIAALRARVRRRRRR